MSKFSDLTGKKFGEWTVIKVYSKGTNKQTKYLCRCSCGKEVAVAGSSLLDGRSTRCRSCGNSGRNPYPPKLRFVFKGMVQRCYDKHQKSYKNYGGKGIGICDEWLADRKNFYAWAVNNGYQDGLQIDRINDAEGYNPHNCRWIPLADNSKRRGRVMWATIDGERKTVAEWARIKGIPESTVRQRIKEQKMTPEEALRA